MAPQSRTGPAPQSSIPERFTESEPDWLAAMLRPSTSPLSGSRNGSEREASSTQSPDGNHAPTPWPRPKMTRREERDVHTRVQQLLRDAQEAVQQRTSGGSDRLAGSGGARALGLDEGIARMSRLVGDGEKLRRRTGENLHEARELFMSAVGSEGPGGEMVGELRQMVGDLESVHERAGRQLADSRSRLEEAEGWKKDERFGRGGGRLKGC
ncbi:hypothetical protein NpPPO83_00011210 [Neofusicoccum parvum]|uniref:Uncharacterized protein n=1 Tax=Neofusicoccum parvum TaxID=310453 RepID=A0ACB5S3E2_9PEZI|nr:hypothetical protein NpPPO83_00011210 [Neofusicoccum parvum]